MSAWIPENDKRQSKGSAKLTDAVNISEPGLRSHKVARDLAITESEAPQSSTSTAMNQKKTQMSTLPATTTTSQSISTKRKQAMSVQDADDEDEDLHTVSKGTY